MDSIVIIVDGIDNLRTEDGSERLTWLPNILPNGVHFIVSATSMSTGSEIPSCVDIKRQEFNYDSE